MKKKVTIIGGGTGTFKVLTGLKKYDELDLSAVVAVTDNGGSSGKLRDEFGYLPAGDIRQCIVALSEADNGRNIMRDLFLYRFEKGGEGLEGHSFGNLFITALSDVFDGDQEKAIKYVSRILRLKGEVIPVSLDNIEIAVKQEDGTVTVGESSIKDETDKRNLESPIVNSWLEPEADATPRALRRLEDSDLIIIGPGGLYTSLLANLMVNGVKEAIESSNAEVLFNMNLMTDDGQTYNMNAKAHLEVLRRYLGSYPDYVLLNNQPIDKEFIDKYSESDDYPVKDDIEDIDGVEIIREDLIPDSVEDIKRRAGFKTKMSVLRHDSDKLASVITDNVLKLD